MRIQQSAYANWVIQMCFFYYDNPLLPIFQLCYANWAIGLFELSNLYVHRVLLQSATSNIRICFLQYENMKITFVYLNCVMPTGYFESRYCNLVIAILLLQSACCVMPIRYFKSDYETTVISTIHFLCANNVNYFQFWTKKAFTRGIQGVKFWLRNYSQTGAKAQKR